MISGSASRCPSSSKRCSAFSSFWRIDAFIFSYSLAAMQSRHLIVAVLQLLAGAALACACRRSAQASSASLHDTEDSNALIMTAEIALQRDDCGRAAANYTIAAQRLTDAKLAERAAGVALDCGQYQAAERAAARWRQLTPSDPAALRAAMRADLGLYKIDDARSAFEAWIKNGGGYAAPQEPAAQRWRSWRFGGWRRRHRRTARTGGAGSRRAGDTGDAARHAGAAHCRAAAAQLALASLAFDGWNYREALQLRPAGAERRRRSRAHAAAAGTGACGPGRSRSGRGRGRGRAHWRRPRSRVSPPPTC